MIWMEEEERRRSMNPRQPKAKKKNYIYADYDNVINVALRHGRNNHRFDKRNREALARDRQGDRRGPQCHTPDLAWQTFH